MIECDATPDKPHRHKDKTKVIQHREQVKKAAAREAKKAADLQRREDNLAARSVADQIEYLKRNGTPRASIPKALRDNYPKHADPSGRNFDSVSLVQLEYPRRWPMDEPSVPMTPSEQLAYLRVVRAFEVKFPPSKAALFIDRWEKFGRQHGVERTPWGEKPYQGSKWWGWPSELIAQFDKQWDIGTQTEEELDER